MESAATTTAGPAVVVGAGPNGLAAAICLASAGFAVQVFEGAASPGGGSRTLELIEPNHWHDMCAAAHPLGAASPFFRSLPLADHGLEWITPDIPVSHPLANGTATALARSIGDTAHILHKDGPAYQRLISPIVGEIDSVLAGSLAPLQSAWRRPVPMAKFGLKAIRSGTYLADRFETEEAKALLAGLAAHAITSLESPVTAGVALLLAATAHTVGWPIAHGGSQSIVDALARQLAGLGGTVTTDRWVESIDEFPPSVPVFLDTSPAAAATIAHSRIDRRSVDRLNRWRHGPGSHKVDWILSDPIPWADELSKRSATVHVGGSFDEIAASETAAVAGRASQHPFAIITQPTLFDDSRAPAGRHIGWAYCHVPAGYEGDATAAIEDQVERFAPGFKDTIIATNAVTATGLAKYNPNYVGGDIGGGALSLRQFLIRPRLAQNPYRIGRNVFLCSASTPPGPGVHGMCGYNAVRYSLRELGALPSK